MTDFWTPRTGKPITGDLKDAKAPDFTVIPDGTKALARIEDFQHVEKTGWDGNPQEFYEITWKLESGDYMGHLVSQKIKCFQGKPEQIDRALNMLKRVMLLAKFKPESGGAPTTEQLKPMLGKIMGIVILEWSMPKNDGTIMEGNYVSEIHQAAGFESTTGEKLEAKPAMTSVESAFSRNPVQQNSDLDDDVPF